LHTLSPTNGDTIHKIKLHTELQIADWGFEMEGSLQETFKKKKKKTRYPTQGPINPRGAIINILEM